MGRKITLLNSENLENRQLRHYNFIGGYFIEMNDFSLETSLLLKFIEPGFMQFDINLTGTYNDIISLGLSYRTDNAVVAMLGLKAGNFRFGYAYDYTLMDIGKYSVGSHEIFLSYLFGDKGSFTKF